MLTPAPTAPPLRALAAAMLSNTVAVLPIFLLGGLAVLIRQELRFSEVQLGLAVAAFSATSTLVSVPGGRLGERIGPERAMAAGAIGSAAAMLGIAVLARSWSTLVALLVLGGAANAVAQPSTNLALARAIPRGRQGLAFGIKQSAVPLAVLLAGSAVPTIGLTVGWRWAFVAAALGALLVIAVLPGGRNPPRPPRVAGPLRAGDAATGPLLILALSAVCAGGSANALGVFYVESAVAGGVREAVAGLSLAAGGATGILARVVWGWLADRRQGGNLRVVAGLQLVGAAGFLLLSAPTQPLALLAGTLLAFAAGWGWPGLFTYAVVRQNPNAPAAATGITQAGVFAGAFLGPPLFGYGAEVRSYPVAWTAGAVALVLAAVLAQAGRRALLRDIARRAA